MYDDGELVMVRMERANDVWYAGIVEYHIREYSPADNLYVVLIGGIRHYAERRDVISATDWQKWKKD